MVSAVARVADLLHHPIVQIAHAEAEATEIDTLLGIAFHHFHQGVGAGDANVEIAVGTQDNAVVAFRVVIGQSLLVGHLQGFAASCAAIGTQTVDGFLDPTRLGDGSRFEQLLYLTRICNE